MATLARGTVAKAKVFFHIEVTAEERDSYWAGTIEQLGTTVYADSFAELKDRVDDAMDLLFNSFKRLEDMSSYLNSRAIAHTVNLPTPEPQAVTRRFLTFSSEAQVAIA